MRNSERHYYLIQLSIISVRREETRGEKEKYLQHYSPKHFLAFLLKQKKNQNLTIEKSLNIPNIIFLVTLIIPCWAKHVFDLIKSSCTSAILMKSTVTHYSNVEYVHMEFLIQCKWLHAILLSLMHIFLFDVLLLLFILLRLTVDRAWFGVLFHWPLANTQWHSAGSSSYHMLFYIPVCGRFVA